MKWEYILEIPFESTAKFFMKGRHKYEFSGNSYFLLDKNGMVLRDFAILDDSKMTFRPNDNDMMIGTTGSGTDFWKTHKHFRGVHFPSSPINKVVDVATKEMVEKLNEHSIKCMRTSLTMEALISGSNTSGADARIEASPMICVDSNFIGMRFINAFKNLRVKRNNLKSDINYPISWVELNASVKLDLKEFFKMFPKHRREFYRFNPESFYTLFEDDNNDITQNIYFDKYKNSQLDSEVKTYKLNVEKAIERYNNSQMMKNALVSYLRGVQRTLLIIEQRKIKEPIVEGRNEKVKNLDAAHLFEVRHIMSSNADVDYRWIADDSNGLLLPKDIHWKFDKDENFYIDQDFNIVENGEIVGRINSKYINENRRWFLEKRNELLFNKVS